MTPSEPAQGPVPPSETTAPPASADRGPGLVDDSMPASPADSLALVQSEQQRAVTALAPDARLILATWGVAWLVGYLLLWGTSPAWESAPLPFPHAVAGVLFAALLVGAALVTVVHTARATAGLRGLSARASAMYGWSWFLGFATLAIVMAALDRFVSSDQVDDLLWPALVGLLVGVLYLAGGALWQDRLQYAIGLWILVAAAAGAWAGVPGNYLVMGLAGGGCFLVSAAGYSVYVARSRARSEV